MRESKRRSVPQSAIADGDGMRRPPGHLITGEGREEVLRKGHGDRATVGVDDDAQGSDLREDETHFPLSASVECRAFVSERILVGLRWHTEKATVFLSFSMSL